MKKIVFILILISIAQTFAQNHAPVFIKEMPDTFILAGKTLLFQYKATDPDGDSISYSTKSVLPMNATLLPKTGVFSWRPANSQQGKYELIVSASDGKLSTDSRKIIIETTYLWDDFGSGSLTINVSHGIGGEVEKHINNDTAFVRAIPYKGYRFTSWTEKGIIVSTDSIYKFRIIVSRDLLANFRINHAPVFVKEMPDTTISNGKTYRYSYKAEDEDGDRVKYTSINVLPNGAELNDSTGLFTWRPKASQGGKHEIFISASDGTESINSRKTLIWVYPSGVYLSVTVINNPLEGGKFIGTQMFLDEGDTISVTLKAIPQKGFSFINWTEKGNVVSTDSIYKFILNDSRTLYANYSLISSQKDNLLPNEYVLSQNFPNPFNPTTTIDYSIPKAEHVTLKVFDVLGREVVTLVNEYKQAGAYKTNFNASGLVSGVYFYQLSAGSFLDVKKMIVVK